MCGGVVVSSPSLALNLKANKKINQGAGEEGRSAGSTPSLPLLGCKLGPPSQKREACRRGYGKPYPSERPHSPSRPAWC